MPLLAGGALRGAEARAVLLQMAGERFGSPVERLRVKDGVVTDSGDATKRVTYGQLVEDGASSAICRTFRERMRARSRSSANRRAVRTRSTR